MSRARASKNDEFYTRYDVVASEMEAYLERDPELFSGARILLPCDDHNWSAFTAWFTDNRERLGIEQITSSCYRRGGRGAVRVTASDIDHSYELGGDGDFRSDEVTALARDADYIITNPPFSLFRAFVDWCEASGADYALLGNVNAVSYRNVFPLIHAGRLRLGPSITSGDREFRVPDDYPLASASGRRDETGSYLRVKGVRWLTTIEHGHKPKPLELRTMAWNVAHHKKTRVRERAYEKYDYYDSLHVPYTDAIPSDYDGVLAVPITFLDQWDPDEFELLDLSNRYAVLDHFGQNEKIRADRAHGNSIGGRPTYDRIHIRRIRQRSM